uniref:Uncharacterized protein n=1 Tax=Trypanosoma congolense (strain IL3000) TaxID=1068625 RepID=G0UNN6_TRYCI|nr:conserved hypothetical protein [Trypanosoma congolense IL3000]
MHRLSLSGCALPTSVDWAVCQTMNVWRYKENNTSIEGSCDKSRSNRFGLSSFWLSRSEIHLIHLISMVKEGGYGASRAGYNNSDVTSTERRTCVKAFVKWDMAINVFGCRYINAAHMSCCSLADSSFFLRFNLPLNEGGMVEWPLIVFKETARQTQKEVSGIKGENVQQFPVFQSPYWLEIEGIRERWPGVDVTSNAVPLFVEGRTSALVNAEQTVDASRFDSLSCGPHRCHECLLCSGVFHISYASSVKLAAALAEMRSACDELSKSAIAGKVSPGLPQDSAEITEPCNLWVDLDVVTSFKWCLESVAAGIEICKSQLRPVHIQETQRPNTDRGSIVLINAKFILQREQLVNIITYVPDIITSRQRVYVPSHIVVRMGLLSCKKGYVSPVWIDAAIVNNLSSAVVKCRNLPGVEIKLLDCEKRKFFTIVVVHRDELCLTDEHIAKLRPSKQ